MGNWRDGERLLAIDPTHRGFGFVVLEGETTLLDWGTRYVANPKEYNSMEKVDRLIDRYRPSVLVLENPTGDGSRRCLRVHQLIVNLAELGRARGMAVFQYSRTQVRLAFAVDGARTKAEIAAVLARRFPELGPKLPPVRKLWMSEDHRMAIFDAAALAVTHFHEQGRGRRTGWPARPHTRNGSSRSSPEPSIPRGRRPGLLRRQADPSACLYLHYIQFISNY